MLGAKRGEATGAAIAGAAAPFADMQAAASVIESAFTTVRSQRETDARVRADRAARRSEPDILAYLDALVNSEIEESAAIRIQRAWRKVLVDAEIAALVDAEIEASAAILLQRAWRRTRSARAAAAANLALLTSPKVPILADIWTGCWRLRCRTLKL